VKLAGSWVPAPGFFVTPDGLVVTNWRLTASAEGILVRAAGAYAPAAAHVVASDSVRDLALLEVPVTWQVARARLEDDEILHAAAYALGVPAADVRAFVAAHR
jgi:S1-C subfamily serine protease